MDKLPVALWMLLWVPCAYLVDVFDVIATGKKIVRKKDGSTTAGVVLSIWIGGTLLLWPWGHS